MRKYVLIILVGLIITFCVNSMPVVTTNSECGHKTETTEIVTPLKPIAVNTYSEKNMQTTTDGQTTVNTTETTEMTTIKPTTTTTPPLTKTTPVSTTMTTTTILTTTTSTASATTTETASPTATSPATATATNTSTTESPATTVTQKTTVSTTSNITSWYIDVKNILQLPELPTGCEATALTMVLNYYGHKVSKLTIVDKYLPRGSVNADPYNVFLGNPYSDAAYGCFAPVIVKTANKYFNDVNSNYKAEDISGSNPSTLYNYIKQGKPVLVWVTIDMKETYISKTWTAVDTGRKIEWRRYEHCCVLIGYDAAKNTVTLNDPLKGIVTYSTSLFENRYNSMLKNAVLITK